MGENKRDRNHIFSHIFTLDEKCKCEYTVFINSSDKRRHPKDAVIAVGKIIDKSLLKELEGSQKSRVN